jgi:hypothetical protein
MARINADKTILLGSISATISEIRGELDWRGGCPAGFFPTKHTKHTKAGRGGGPRIGANDRESDLPQRH